MYFAGLASTVLLLVAINPALAADTLQWSSTRIHLELPPEQDSVATDFLFQNTGIRPLSVVGIVTSCPCTTATASKTTLIPGERGRIHAVFEAGRLTGTVTKIVTVTTDEPGATPAELTLEVHIQQYVSVEPMLINWTTGGDPSEKTISCTAQSPHRMSLTGVTCSLPDIAAKIETLETGRRYSVKFSSATHPNHDTALIQFKVEVDGVGKRVIDAYAYFR